MHRRLFSSLAAVLVGVLLISAQPAAFAAAIPSKAEQATGTASRDASLATIEELLARREVGEALAAHGLTAEEIESRLAQLSDQDLHGLALNLDQIQAAGNEVPEYIWWLVGGLLGVLILVAIF